jgi:hypothetical protein
LPQTTGTGATFNGIITTADLTGADKTYTFPNSSINVNAASDILGTTLASNVVTSSLTSVGTLTNLTVTNPISGSVTGNAATATALQTARTINGVSFDGTTNITVTAAQRAFALHRIRGEILLKRDPANTASAEEAFLTAIAIAQQQKARSFELRAAMSMARLWRDQGKRDGARELLAPIYGWFTEGFDTLDLKEAKALLDELAS